MIDETYSTYTDGKFTEVYSVDDICTSIRARIDSANKKAEYAYAEMEKMKNEKWKDNELRSMKNQLKAMELDYYRGFPISESEQKAISEWKDHHWTNQHNAPTNEKRLKRMGAIGGSFSYEFVPTSIGTSGAVCCQSCLAKARAKAYQEMYEEKDSKFNLQDRLRELIKEYDAKFQFQEL